MKQEKIREGITEILEHYYGSCGMTHSSVAGAIMEREDKLGVVIKVDTSNYVNHTVTVTEGLNSTTFPARLLNEAGYVAVEPLI